jgi:hypothetical protein
LKLGKTAVASKQRLQNQWWYTIQNKLHNSFSKFWNAHHHNSCIGGQRKSL